MTYYYEKLEDGTIGKYTTSLKVAKLNNFDFSTNEKIVGYKGKSYLESEFEQIKQSDDYKAEQLAYAKESKTQEATDKAYSFEEKDALVTVNATNLKTRASGIYHIEGNLTNNIKMSAYASTLDDTTVVPWNTKENVNILLNKTACQTLTSLMSQMNAKLWTVDFPTYLAQIEAAQTADEVNAINIEYQNPSEVVDINIPPSIEEDSGADTEGDEPSASINDEAAEEVTDEDTTVE